MSCSWPLVLNIRTGLRMDEYARGSFLFVLWLKCEFESCRCLCMCRKDLLTSVKTPPCLFLICGWQNHSGTEWVEWRFEFVNYFHQLILATVLIIFLSKSRSRSLGWIHSQGPNLPQHTLRVCSRSNTHSPHACSNGFSGSVIYAFKMWPHCALTVHSEITEKSEMQCHSVPLSRGPPPTQW